MTKVTIKYLKESIKEETEAINDYHKHGIHNIEKDERSHRRMLKRKLKALEKKQKRRK